MNYEVENHKFERYYPSARIVKRRLDKLTGLTVSRISPDIVSQAIKNSGNSPAAGPDDLTIGEIIWSAVDVLGGLGY